ncbi:hypothetical protein [Geodermatophilus sp. URMC 64]
MPQPAPVPPELRRAIFRGSTAVAAGLLTRHQLHGALWRRLFPDVYVHRDAPVDHALRARAAAGVLLPGAVVTGLSAAVLWGLDLASERDDVELTLPPGRHPVRIPGLRVRRATLLDDAVREHRRVRVTTPEATAVRLSSALPVDEAVAAVDRMITRRLVSLSSVRDAAADARGGIGPGPSRRNARGRCG